MLMKTNHNEYYKEFEPRHRALPSDFDDPDVLSGADDEGKDPS